METSNGTSQAKAQPGAMIMTDETNPSTELVSSEGNSDVSPSQALPANDEHDMSVTSGVDADPTKAISFSRNDQSSQ